MTSSSSEPKKLSPVEAEKENSRYLRGKIVEQLKDDVVHFDASQHNLIKCHGMYEQDDRDKRQELLKQKKDKAYSLMVRTKTPGGRLTSAQYLVLDELCEKYANSTLRITTRQGIQFHGILKKNLKTQMKEINQALITTFGACGDVVRNVCSCPAPLEDRIKMRIHDLAQKISNHFLPRTGAYHEIWLDEKPVEDSNQEVEPIYGKTYLPRKFKFVIAFPGDNCVDIYAHDVGMIPVFKADKLEGFDLVAGGGLGMTHNIPETYPVLAKPLGFVAEAQLMDALEAIVKVQRDFGNRVNRKRARLKYLIEEKGIPWFRSEVENYAGFKLTDFRSVKWSKTEDHVGWHENGRGTFFYGLFVENGRIKDEGQSRIRAGIRALVQRWNPMIYLTLQQNILFDGIPAGDRTAFESLLREYGILNDREISNALRWSMACPALPTCGLAITESERALPDIIREIGKQAETLGLSEEKITIRMTGCPNGCSRPYTAEIGLVGHTVGTYALYVGADFEGTRLSQPLLGKVKTQELSASVGKLLEIYKKERNQGERFGDFCHRMGHEKLRSYFVPEN